MMLFPLGIFVPLWIKEADNVKKVAMTGFIVSLIIEVAQLITTRGYFEIDDLFHNTLGAFIGAFIGCQIAKKLYSKDNSQ